MSNSTEARAIEQRLLELAYTTDTKLTATALAYFAPCTIADASKVLEDLTARGQLTMEVEDDGAIVYTMPGRQKLGASQSASGDASPRRESPFDRLFGRDTTRATPLDKLLRRETLPARRVNRGQSPTLAAVLSAVVPGAGHVYTGHIFAALMWFMVVGIGYALIVPGLLLHIWCMVSAARKALPQPRPMLLLA